MIGFFILTAAAALQVTAAADADPERQVRAALEQYLQGQATGDARHYERVFHPDARLAGVRNGRYETRTLREYLSMQSGRPAADEAERRRSIQDVRVAGDAAVATIVLDYPAALTTDYMSLVRVNGEWRIVHKLYNVKSRARSPE